MTFCVTFSLQADGTAWMAFYCVIMLNIALDLAIRDDTYEDMASKFFEHFTQISDAINQMSDGVGLWDEKDGFYYDHLSSDSSSFPLRVRSMVGLVPLMACLVLDDEYMNRLPGFKKRLDWFMKNRKDLASQVSNPARHSTIRSEVTECKFALCFACSTAGCRTLHVLF